ncbi:class I SAM-dependent methyltransferase [Desulfurispira natronophila]|uniref:SAM-dependent methyltransferase n=1 Tax=Desulfurispira natronophila TaxID=682562 RepID=A0A7W8DHL4_9BACT|nr:class I SAM-dependent methyltransferase [Desulfurispira natronophila]MBB5022681.1 SAM-dependent methyltransferase [Desulfurispira natronophila]
MNHLHQPHASWAQYYDLVFAETFGEAYQDLTDKTLAQVRSCAEVGCRIVDFGAGTGRLAIPLAQYGYCVTAVEPCWEMLQQLAHKPGAEDVKLTHSTMAQFVAKQAFDAAICAFTVLMYLLDEEALQASLQAVADSLASGGLLLIDIPDRQLFQGFVAQTKIMERQVDIDPLGGGLYCFSDQTFLQLESGTQHYYDEFCIRYWDSAFVVDQLRFCGFEVEADLSADFADFMSHYLLLRKM